MQARCPRCDPALYWITNLLRLQNFPKKWYFLPPDTHTYVGVTGGKKFNFLENTDNALNELSLYTLNKNAQHFNEKKACAKLLRYYSKRVAKHSKI